ncbi:MAG: hypothetical protein K8R59_02650 [Thermoanaerobaculales bacterium]|nr:hypothetical protein [Thermoanaerobaculales bacterium]
MNKSLLLLFLVSLLAPVTTESSQCLPCVGVIVDDPIPFVTLLEDGLVNQNPKEAGISIQWPAPLDGSFDTSVGHRMRAAGAYPMVALQFTTSAPSEDVGEGLAAELSEVIRIARALPPETRFLVKWSFPIDSPKRARDYAFLLKRASVAVKSSNPSADVLTGLLPNDEVWLRELFSTDIAAYVDGVGLTPADSRVIASTLILLMELDPGKTMVIGSTTATNALERIPVESAQNAAAGINLTLFDLRHTTEIAAHLGPLRLMAREFHGDLSFDPSSGPEKDRNYWSFVRSEDLGLRTVVDLRNASETRIRIPDRSLADPTIIHQDGTEERLPWRRVPGATEIDLPDAGVAVLRIGRLAAIDLGGFEAAVEVAGTRRMPVEEILQKLQVFEEDQARRLQHYEATYTQHLRFRPGSGLEPIEATFSGPFFFRRDEGFDWMWRDLFIAGVHWRGKIPELPLLQPARAATLPLEIHLDRQYSYRLRGTAVISDRDCWVVDFEPADLKPSEGMWNGTVWIDRKIYTRVKTRALQVGLTGNVLSNEETTYFSPVDIDGRPAPWEAGAFVLPTRVVGQELQSILNASVQVVKESVLSEIRINREDIEERLAAAHASDDTMVRDTPDGLRYLEKTEDGSRQVQQDFDQDRLFAIGGSFYDASVDYPLPLLGVNYFSNDFLGSGNQLNIFFAGVLLRANWADPSFLQSRWDVGAQLSGFAVAREELLYRGAEEAPGETVERRDAGMAVFLGHPIGGFGKVDFTFGLEYDWFGRADDTHTDFMIPQSTPTHFIGTDLSYSRGGYRFSAEAFGFARADWHPWGMPGSSDFDAAHKSYTKWEVSLSKTWWINGFTKVGLTLEHLDGSDLDRFSKYGFGPFADSRVAGYEHGRITAEKADAVHLSYGFNFAELLRLELRGDAAWADDQATGLERELLAGLSLNGTLMGPWQTIVNFDIGIPIAGPAEDFTVYIVFLKLFD